MTHCHVYGSSISQSVTLDISIRPVQLACFPSSLFKPQQHRNLTRPWRILGIVACTDASSCYLPTPELHMTPSRLVNETPVIVRAKVISTDKGGAVEYAKQPGSYRFQATEVIRGTSATTTDLPGDLDPSSIWDTNFSDHKDPSFLG
jgi:hypothetical protein